ncbi:MAG: asparagine synthase-related protein [Nitrososphaerota archaeon]|nr:asparagine synthase-related protein [Candidatus Bathyarchaeota archaeon]MDW8022533.1 asparagine synthase-related protein [Nitrososphaerota archaeon]
MYQDGDAIPATSSIVNETCSRLRSLLESSVKRNMAEGILLSGGLDTSVLAFIASKFASLKSFTVAFEGAPAPDVQYASLMARKLGLKHVVHYFGERELYDAIRAVVATVKSFDPMEVRNSAAIYEALKLARREGLNSVMTGDGCDELFAGYDFLVKMEGEKLKQELVRIWNVMSFSSIPLAQILEIQAKLPYLDPELKDFAMKLDLRYKVRSEKGQVWGKWILRKAFEGILPDEIVWRAKAPIEAGSGTTILPSIFNQKISDEEFEEKRRKYLKDDGVTIRDKEQLFYYEVYRSTVGVPHLLSSPGRHCPLCHSNVNETAKYCRTCGAYPI